MAQERLRACERLSGQCRGSSIDRLMLGTVCGVLFGLLAAGMTLPMAFPDKRAALLGAFLNRLSLGVAIGLGAASVSLSGWAVGLGLGLFLSAGDAVITKAYLPILAIGVLGVLGGAATGFVVTAWGCLTCVARSCRLSAEVLVRRSTLNVSSRV